MKAAYLLALALLAALGALWHTGSALQAERLAHQTTKTEHAEVEVQRQRETLRAIEAAQAETIRLQEVSDEARRKATQRIQSNARDASAARTELDRLRNAIATGPGCEASGPAGTERADPARELLGACALAIEDMARKADGHAADALMLYEAWPRNEATEAAAP